MKADYKGPPLRGTDARYTEVTLGLVIASIKRVFTREAMHRIAEQGMEMVADQAGEELAVTLIKNLQTHKVLSTNEDVEAWLDVPWEANVLIERPRSFGDRLLRRRPRRDWVTVTGRIKQRGTVRVHLEHRYEFPESRYVWPEMLGEPRKVSAITVLEDPRWTPGMQEMTTDVPIAHERRP